MNMRMIFSTVAAGALLATGPGWALANSADVSGDVDGTGNAVVDDSGLSGAGDATGDASMDIEVPEAPQAGDGEAPEAPELETPEAPEASALTLPAAPEAPEGPQVPDPAVSSDDEQATDDNEDGSEVTARGEGRGSASGHVGGDSDPSLDHEADGNASAEVLGNEVSVP